MKISSPVFVASLLRSFLSILAITVSLLPSARCLAAPGQLDTSFKGFGIASGGWDFSSDDLALQGDGKMIVVGTKFTTSTASLKLARFRQDGALDTSFNGTGVVDVENWAYWGRVAVQSDGKIVVAATGAKNPPTTTENNFILFRYKTDGSRDFTFGTNGRVVTDFGINASPADIAIQADGKIVVAGTSNLAGSYSTFALARYNINGSLDATFNGTGTVTTAANNAADAYSTGSCVLIQNDGRIVVVGQTGIAIGSRSDPNGTDLCLARYETTGSLDATFGSGGKVTTNFVAGDYENLNAAIAGDGRIIVGGRKWTSDSSAPIYHSELFLASYTRAGAVDAGFGLGGSQIIRGWSAGRMALQNDGKILVSGSASGSGFFVARYTPTGFPDTTFGNVGNIITGIFSNFYFPGGMAVQKDGRIILTGENVIARLLGDGRKAQITNPANGSTLTSTSLPLAWNSGLDALGYVLWVGTTPGGYDVHVSHETGTSRTVAIPAGRRIYVTLWTLLSGTYQPNYYVFEPPTAAAATLITPVSVNAGTAVLNWTPGVGASSYAVWLGSARDGRDLGEASLGTATTWAFNNLPRDGGPIYVTLWSLINGVWQPNRNWFTASAPTGGASRSALLTSPANGSVLTSPSIALRWDGGVGATGHALWVGSTPGGYDISATHEEGNLGKTLIVPADGRIIYVTLFSLIGTTYQSNSYYFTTASLPDGGAARITSPATGSAASPTGAVVAWDAAAGATQYYLTVGSTPGGADLYSASQGTKNAMNLPAMPTDGRPMYLTLYSWMFNAWKPSSRWCYADNSGIGNKPSLILSPANETTLTGTSTTFQWNGGVGVSLRALWVGSSPGGADLWASSESSTTTSRTVTGLPTDGRKIHVTLFSLLGGAWRTTFYEYTAATAAVSNAAIISPTPGTKLTGTTATFTWSASSSAAGYVLWVGRKPGGSDVFVSAAGTDLSRTVTTLPTDGGPVYVTIWSQIRGVWQSNEAIYQAADP